MSDTPTIDPTFITIPTRSRRRRISPLLLACSGVLLFVAVCAVAGSAVAPHDPGAQDLALGPAPASADHWLGTDGLGRDVLSRLIAGTRNAVVGPLLVAISTVLIGTTLGMVAGLRGGRVDSLICRFADLVYALPALLMVIVIVGMVGGGTLIAWAVFIFFSIPTEIRLTRSATLRQSKLAYLDAARTLGLSTPRILFRHVLPNILPTVVATGMLDFVGALVGLSSLAFLGLGVAPGTADWGLMLAEERSIMDLNVWAALGPALMIILTAVSGTVLGDWLYDRLSQDRGRA
ncbi:ABC transporter permease [Kribbella sancticallisti]|uniref:ABC transporter permease n=1 Tax=Kribbella sancticallisti TaxID=460087 RepID=A0ABN2DRR5_9ACTN